MPCAATRRAFLTRVAERKGRREIFVSFSSGDPSSFCLFRCQVLVRPCANLLGLAGEGTEASRSPSSTPTHSLPIMPCSAALVGPRIRSWLRDYDRIQSVAVVLIYVQIGCSLIGSLGAYYNGVLLINLVVALFALVAIENNSQGLGRTYAALLACGILLDIMWFIIFSHQIWNISIDGPLIRFSVRLVLWMQIIGFSVRSLSSLLWIQMYRLGVSLVESAAHRSSDFDARNSFLNPPVHVHAREDSNSDDILGGSIYDTAYYSSLFEDALEKRGGNEGGEQIICVDNASTSAAEPLLRPCMSRSFQVIDDTDARNTPQKS